MIIIVVVVVICAVGLVLVIGIWWWWWGRGNKRKEKGGSSGSSGQHRPVSRTLSKGSGMSRSNQSSRKSSQRRLDAGILVGASGGKSEYDNISKLDELATMPLPDIPPSEGGSDYLNMTELDAIAGNVYHARGLVVEREAGEQNVGNEYDDMNTAVTVGKEYDDPNAQLE